MHSGFCDGLPVHYTASPPASDETDHPPRAYDAQAQDAGLGPLDGFYIPPPPLRLPAEICQPRPQASPDPPGARTPAAPAAYPRLPSHSASLSSSSSGLWPTPPSTTCEDFEDYSYHGSPASTGVPLATCPARSSAASPRSWSSPELQQVHFQPGIWKGQDPLPPYRMPLCTSMPPEERFPPPPPPQQQQQQQQHEEVEGLSYPSAHFLSNSPDPDAIMSQDAPALTPDQADSMASGDSPPPKDEYRASYLVEGGEAAHAPAENGDASSDGEEGSQTDIPYAQLIFRAFMSRENHAMTLQEIYEWFRQNTDKARGDTKGWMNSIRHNLSMNQVPRPPPPAALTALTRLSLRPPLTRFQAFVKMSELLAEAGVMEPPGQPRRANEWVLRDWAITDGVKSTTRYRKGVPGRRGAAARSQNNGMRAHHHNSRSHNSHSARASSGRKGGLSASKTKAAANREKLRLQQRHNARYSAVHEMHLPSSYHPVPSYYGRYGSDYGQGLKEEAAGPSTDGGDMLFPSHGMMGAELAASSNPPYYQNYVTAPASHTAFPPYQSQHTMQHRPPVFKVEQTTGVFEPPASEAGGLGLASRSAYHQVYTDDLGNGGASEVSTMRPTHLPYSHPGWSDGQQS